MLSRRHPPISTPEQLEPRRGTIAVCGPGSWLWTLVGLRCHVSRGAPAPCPLHQPDAMADPQTPPSTAARHDQREHLGRDAEWSLVGLGSLSRLDDEDHTKAGSSRRRGPRRRFAARCRRSRQAGDGAGGQGPPGKGGRPPAASKIPGGAGTADHARAAVTPTPAPLQRTNTPRRSKAPSSRLIR